MNSLKINSEKNNSVIKSIYGFFCCDGSPGETPAVEDSDKSNESDKQIQTWVNKIIVEATTLIKLSWTFFRIYVIIIKCA